LACRIRDLVVTPAFASFAVSVMLAAQLRDFGAPEFVWIPLFLVSWAAIGFYVAPHVGPQIGKAVGALLEDHVTEQGGKRRRSN
jgi:hypothetical protein